MQPIIEQILDQNEDNYNNHRWARYFKKVAERALNAKKNFKALALYKAFKAIAAQKKKFKALKHYKMLKQ